MIESTLGSVRGRTLADCVLAALLLIGCSSPLPGGAAQNRRQNTVQTPAAATQAPPSADIPNPSVSDSGASTARAGAAAPTQPSRNNATTTPQNNPSKVMNDCPGSLDPKLAASLQAADVKQGRRWLYPYDQTVFPKGLLAPVLQWDGQAAEAVYLHMSSKSFDYRGCFNAGPAASFAIPEAAWQLAGTQSQGKADPLTVELTISSSGALQRLPPLTLIFALASLKGALYYNTYGSTIATNQGIIGGVVMRILPGRAQPEVFVTVPAQNGECVGCHAVSANGTRLIAETHAGFGTAEASSAAYDLTSAAGAANPPVKSTLSRAGFAALTPDGSKFLIQGGIEEGPGGHLASSGTVGNVPGSFGPRVSALYETDTNKELPDSGIVPYPYMPMFSGDGKLIVFNAIDKSDTSTGHTLAVMDFDNQTNKFSNLRPVYRSATRFPSWPFFLPEVVREAQGAGARSNRRIIFALGEADFSTQEAALFALTPHRSDLWWLDIESGIAAPLHRANGVDATGKSYLPYPEHDVSLSFYPTVSPVAAGGYFWVFFTSKRNYGNIQITDQPDGPSTSKKIWASAIDIDAAPGSDPSHPAFYLPGQELESGNVRAFASLEACRKEGESCASGIDCCCGLCSNEKCACEKTTTCSKLNERCTSASDCCDGSLYCIGGFCAEVIAPQ